MVPCVTTKLISRVILIRARNDRLTTMFFPFDISLDCHCTAGT
jgi:hypothetical protein